MSDSVLTQGKTGYSMCAFASPGVRDLLRDAARPYLEYALREKGWTTNFQIEDCDIPPDEENPEWVHALMMTGDRE